MSSLDAVSGVALNKDICAYHASRSTSATSKKGGDRKQNAIKTLRGVVVRNDGINESRFLPKYKVYANLLKDFLELTLYLLVSFLRGIVYVGMALESLLWSSGF